MQAALRLTVDTFGGLDIAFNNAGIERPPASSIMSAASVFDMLSNARRQRRVERLNQHVVTGGSTDREMGPLRRSSRDDQPRSGLRMAALQDPGKRGTGAGPAARSLW